MPKVWEEDASWPLFQTCPSHVPTIQNHFSNQDEALNDEGYNFKGNLTHFNDEENDDMEGYSDPQIGVKDAPAPPAPAVVA